MGRSFESVRLGVQQVSARWARAGRHGHEVLQKVF